MYQALIRSLTYTAMSRCPDIGYITQYLSQVIKIQSQCDWNTTKRVLRYLKRIKELGITYKRDANNSHHGSCSAIPWGYCDANYAEDPCDCKSMSGYAFILMGGAISWKSKKQTSVFLSTTEAEYYALGIACQEAIWIKQICQEL